MVLLEQSRSGPRWRVEHILVSIVFLPERMKSTHGCLILRAFKIFSACGFYRAPRG